MTRTLTQKTIDAIRRSGPPARRTEISDGLVPGLRLVIQPSGAMSWALRYRFAGVSRKFTIGKYGPEGSGEVSLAKAREKARDAKDLIREGNDPGVARKKDKRQKRLEAEKDDDKVSAIFETFMERAVKPKNRTAPETRRMFEKRILPALGDKRIGEVTRSDVLKMLDKIIDEGAPIAANRTFAAIRRFGSWSVERGLIAQNFCDGIKAPAEEKSRDRVLTDDEIRLLWMATERMGYPFGIFARLLLLTGARRDEVAKMTWAELDFENAVWTIPRSRSKNDQAHTVPLSDMAIAELEKAPRIGEKPTYVFTSGRSRSGRAGSGEVTAIGGYSKSKAAIAEKMIEAAKEDGDEAFDLPHWTYHDLRRTCASGMARLGIPVHVVEAVLNHKSGTIRGVAAVYNRYSYEPEKRRALEAWGRAVRAIVDGEDAGNVIHLEA